MNDIAGWIIAIAILPLLIASIRQLKRDIHFIIIRYKIRRGLRRPIGQFYLDVKSHEFDEVSRIWDEERDLLNKKGR